MKAEIIAVGTEILTGQIVNTNAQFLSEKLSRNRGRCLLPNSCWR